MTTDEPSPRAAGRLLSAAYVVAVLALVVPRLHSSSALWLDEALSVDIARLPVPDLIEALRHDGSPPVYYLLLHVWMAVFGTGDVAVRALSTLVSLAALPVAYVLGRRLGGQRAARGALLVLAATPFAIRYATETRMYALVVLLALLGILAALRALESPTLARLAQVSLVAGLLALTHYWTLFFLVGATATLLALAWRPVPPVRRQAALRSAAAVPVGGLLFVPWLPSFLYQAAHTGTPWRTAPTWTDLPSAVSRWGGPGVLGGVFGVVLLLLALYGARSVAGRRLVGLGLGALVLGLVVCRVQGAAFALRYSAPMVAPMVVAAGLGLAGLPRRARLAAATVVVAGALAVVGFSSLLDDRTEAAPVAQALEAGVGDGDTVVYCPDQLAPPVARLLPAAVHQVVYPTLAGPALIDWVDYAARNEAASPERIADRINASTTGAVWLVRADDYLTYGDQCAQLDDDLAALRGGRVVHLLPGPSRDGAYVISYAAP